MIPRALVSPVMAIGRGPTRPAIEGHLVRSAVDALAPRSAPREPLARDLAQQVVEELIAYLAEDDDPLLAAIGEAQRTVCPSPVVVLATDPNIDTLALFIDMRVERLRSRCGRGLSPGDEATELRNVMGAMADKLAGRYLRHLRSG